jgi:hypothetical protein
VGFAHKTSSLQKCNGFFLGTWELFSFYTFDRKIKKPQQTKSLDYRAADIKYVNYNLEKDRLGDNLAGALVEELAFVGAFFLSLSSFCLMLCP